MPEETDPQVQAAADDFDVVDWLSDVINAEAEITVYRDGTRLLELAELADLAGEAIEKAKGSKEANLTIADEYNETAEEARVAAEKLREELTPSGLTFKLRSIGTEARDMLLKTVEQRFKAQPAKGDEPAVKGGQDHPDFFETFQDELLARTIVSATTAQGKTDGKKWTAERVHKLRSLPQFEFHRLWRKGNGLYTTQYDIDKMFDLDFSSRL